MKKKYNKNKVALITGVTGQDGSYLAQFLLDKGYKVHGIKRRSSSINTDRIDSIYQGPERVDRRFILHYGDLTDSSSLNKIISQIKPNEIYNLGAQSHVGVSFEMPIYTSDVNALGTLRILESIKNLNLTKKTKFYQASSSELYGKTDSMMQSEKTPFHPFSPYAVSKLFAHWITINYREAYDLFAVNGILFNHESPQRGETFVTRKITMALSKIYLGLQNILLIGNLDSKRDWGHAKDYIEMQWLMLQQKKPVDYVIATGIQRSVRDFINESANLLGMKIKWVGKGLNERGLHKGKAIIKVDKRYYRPSDVVYLKGNSAKARNSLGWFPKYNFKRLVKEMIENDLIKAQEQMTLKSNYEKN
jgi:GDPmannose 4,6-dehydratase